MEFQWNNQNHILQGIDSQSIQHATMKTISEDGRQGCSLFAICHQSIVEPTPQDVHMDMKQLLENFQDLF